MNAVFSSQPDSLFQLREQLHDNPAPSDAELRRAWDASCEPSMLLMFGAACATVDTLWDVAWAAIRESIDQLGVTDQTLLGLLREIEQIGRDGAAPDQLRLVSLSDAARDHGLELEQQEAPADMPDQELLLWLEHVQSVHLIIDAVCNAANAANATYFARGSADPAERVDARGAVASGLGRALDGIQQTWPASLDAEFCRTPYEEDEAHLLVSKLRAPVERVLKQRTSELIRTRFTVPSVREVLDAEASA